MIDGLRTFVSGDALVVLFAGLGVICSIAIWRVWRSPHSWHIDGDTKELRFHAWPELLMAGAGVCTFALLTFLTF